mmetsp:Transcript_50944/g.62385  ORF Transcript_50944/g.62385 Transcript_50944/m.62385 type:complete len:249 (-) Transcript_50944:94-840(-)
MSFVVGFNQQIINDSPKQSGTPKPYTILSPNSSLHSIHSVESDKPNRQITKSTLNFAKSYSNFLIDLYNEPTQGLYYVNKHLLTLGPKIIEIKNCISKSKINLQTCLTDIFEDIEAVDKILRSQLNLDGQSPLKDEMKRNPKNNDELIKLRDEFGNSQITHLSKKIDTTNNNDINDTNNNDNNDDNKNDINNNDGINNDDMNGNVSNDTNTDNKKDNNDDFGFGEFLHISDMINQSRSLMTELSVFDI